MWDGLAEVVDAADSAYALFAIAMIGMFALAWRWGGKLLDKLAENTRVTKESKEVAVEAKKIATGVAESIVTNHGSKNLGDAVDRITAWLVQHMEESRHTNEQLHTLQSVAVASAIESDAARERITERFTDIDDVLDAIKKRLANLEKNTDPPLFE